MTSDDREISDEAFRRILVGIGVVVAIAALSLGAVGVVRWVDAAGRKPTPLSNVDVGFLRDMITHHQQALLIAQTYMDNNPSGAAHPYASEVVWFQTAQITKMKGWLTAGGFDLGAPDRQAMTWMGMGTDLAEMPGMQTPQRIAELSAASGSTADRLFFDIMSAHHLGGADMADYAATFGGRQNVKDLAESIAYNQRIEVVEYAQAVKRLGLQPASG